MSVEKTFVEETYRAEDGDLAVTCTVARAGDTVQSVVVDAGPHGKLHFEYGVEMRDLAACLWQLAEVITGEVHDYISPATAGLE
jgi:hypothetical protein